MASGGMPGAVVATVLDAFSTSDWATLAAPCEEDFARLEKAVRSEAQTEDSYRLDAQTKCRILMQMLSVPEDAPDAVKAAARKLAEAVLSSQPLIKTAAAWPRMFAQTILEMRPWLAGSAASSGGAAVPDDLTAQANAVAAAVRAATRSLTVAEGRPMPSVEARGPLYRYADCDDLPPGAEIADAALLAPLLPVGAEAPAHFHRSGEWLAREVAAAAWWQSQEEKAIALQAEAAAAAGMVVSGGPDAAEAASAAERSDMAAASSSSSAQP